MSYIKSVVVQRSIPSPSHASAVFDMPSGNEVPIVLVPADAACFHFNVNVPSGHYCLAQSWHKHVGMQPAGLIKCWPAWNRISHIVTRATKTYNVPARQCPTQDNVMVDVNISLTFRIGPDEQAAYDFVYRLGAQRFDEFLSAQSAESVRGLVHSVTHDRVNDLREEFAQGILATLNRKCNDYGVQIQNVKITDVALPASLTQTLERTTAFKTKMEEQAKKHENRVQNLQDAATQQLETLRKTHARRKQDLLAQISRFEIETREIESAARGELTESKTRAESDATVSVARARADKEVAETQGRREAEELRLRTQTECEAMRKEADQRAATMITRSQATLNAAEAKAQAMIAQAEAEEANTQNLAESRRFELEQRRLDLLNRMAGRGRRFISGDTGRQLLESMIPAPAESK